MSMVFQPWRCWYRHKDNPCPKCWEWMQKQVPRCETMEAALSDLAKEIKHRLQLLMQRFPKRAEVAGAARAARAGPAATQMRRDVEDLIVRAGQVQRREAGQHQRMRFEDLELKRGVTSAGRIVPKLPPALTGRVKLRSLNSYDLVEDQLRKHPEITGWTSKRTNRQTGLDVKGLQALLPTETVWELSGGRYNKEEEVVYVLPYLSDEDIVSGDADDNEMLTALGGASAHGGAGDASDASAVAAVPPPADTARSSSGRPTQRSSGRLAAKRASGGCENGCG